jgi:two-component system sensor histidine kinase QseC
VARRAGSEAARDEALDALVAGAGRAARLIEQMLTLARLESGQPQGAMQRVELRALARDALAELAPRALAKRLDIALEDGPEVAIEGHPGLLGVLLRNLIDNAVRYTPPGGSVRVALRTPAELEVRDSGPGVPAAELPRLGQRFHRLAQDEAGSGLGLSIVLRIAELHGADVRFAPGPDRGLAVRVRFPEKQR